MDKYTNTNAWKFLPPEDKAVWTDIKNIIDNNIRIKAVK